MSTLRIREVPVGWTEDADSRVDIVKTATGELKGVVLRFAVIGASSTLAYLALYAVLRIAVAAQAANAVALLATAIGNTAANRRFTFAVRGHARVVTHHVQSLVVFGLALGLTSGSITLLQTVDPRSSRGVELAVLTAANLIATVLRFVLLRIWVFRDAAR